MHELSLAEGLPSFSLDLRDRDVRDAFVAARAATKLERAIGAARKVCCCCGVDVVGVTCCVLPLPTRIHAVHLTSSGNRRHLPPEDRAAVALLRGAQPPGCRPMHHLTRPGAGRNKTSRDGGACRRPTQPAPASPTSRCAGQPPAAVRRRRVHRPHLRAAPARPPGGGPPAAGDAGPDGERGGGGGVRGVSCG